MGYNSDKEVVFAFLKRIDFNKDWSEIEYDLGYDLGDYGFGEGDGEELRKKIKETAKYLKTQFDGIFDDKGNTILNKFEGMKNTTHNKRRFFALYFGQKVVSNVNYLQGHEESILTLDSERFEHTIKWVDEGYFLELTPLSQLTPEDAVEVAKMSKSYFEDGKVWGRTVIKSIFLDDFGSYSASSIMNIEHYLRSRGYAIQWNGVSVKEQIEWGWIKLKEKN